MKKSLKFLVPILFTFITFAIFICISINQPYTKIIYSNWDIKLPTPYKEIYYTDSGESFHGDGERYSVFQYKKEKDILESLNWQDGKKSSIEESINEVLIKLNVSVENMPNFKNSYKYYATGKEDHSKIYFIFFTDTKKLHVIEDIY